MNRTRYISLIMLLFSSTIYPQDLSLFFNSDGQMGSEENLAIKNNISTIKLYRVVETDTCLNEVIFLNKKGLVIRRTEYSCESETYQMVYKEEFEYDVNDSLIWESYISIFNDETSYHYRSHEFHSTASGIEKISVTRTGDMVWDSIITLYNANNQIMEKISYGFPAPGKIINPQHFHYAYHDGLPISLSGSNGVNAKYGYDQNGRIISSSTEAIAGVYYEEVKYRYSRDKLVSVVHSFPYKIEFDFKFKDGRLISREQKELNFKTGKMEKIESVTFNYLNSDLPVVISIKDNESEIEVVYYIEYTKDNNELVLTVE